MAKTAKRRAKKNVHAGIVHIKASFNNTHITITSTTGDTISWGSAGTVGFKGTRKSTPLAAQRASESAAQAAVIVEPVAGNMGVVPPRPGFLEGLREICDRNGSLLIFDEVMTGFRVGPGGAQGRFGVEPDLTCLGKVVAGGAPAAAYGGTAQLMRQVAPDGPVYQAGTLAGNPLATAAGLATLREVVASPDLYDRLEAVGALLEGSINDAIDRTGATACVQRVGAMLTVFFGVDEVWSWDQASNIDRDAFSRFFQSARRRGVMLPPSPFEALFLMRAHEGVADQLAEALALSFEEAVT